MRTTLITIGRFIVQTMFGLLLTAPVLNAQGTVLGMFDNHTDIGNSARSGSVIYNKESQEYVIEGSGANIWANSDQFQFVWKKIKGDFILTAKAEFIGEGVELHRKIGWMVRSSLDSSSTHACAAIHGDGLTSLQYRRTNGGITEEVKSAISGPTVIQLERRGKIYILSAAHYGEPFVSEQLDDLELGDEVFVGLFVCSHNKSVSEKAIFSNVSITIPVRADYVPYQDYIGSNLEIMDVESGQRKIIYQSAKSLQAPNWTRDGKTLVFNSEGLLYSFDLATHTPTVLNTGTATNNNNDHVLSFDGKMIGISNHSMTDKGNSIVYTVPIAGGEPKRITDQGPSYLHGWSPDGKFLVYTGARNDEYDIYRIPVAGGKEVRLTNAKGLDDGSEYSPDGQTIYFNSNRTGTMQIWRMKPDGSKQEQLTFGELNDWFPHISPDGKWIVLISFGKDVDSGDHPFYKHVYLRLMPIGGGSPKVIAYLYGGQGTMNVPSWSPDGKRIAFVSNTRF